MLCPSRALVDERLYGTDVFVIIGFWTLVGRDPDGILILRECCLRSVEETDFAMRGSSVNTTSLYDD